MKSICVLNLLLAFRFNFAVQIDGWYSCNLYTTSAQNSAGNAECAHVEVPLCYASLCSSQSVANRSIRLFVKRILANVSRPKRAIWVLQGGPGIPSYPLEGAMAMFSRAFDYKADIYTMDQRGVGRSNRLQCEAAQAETSGSPSGSRIAPEELISCAEDISHDIDGQFQAFSTTSAAYDLKNLIALLNREEDFRQDVYIYGVSYGTLLIERYLQIAPNQAQGIILDSIVLQQGQYEDLLGYSSWDIGVGLIAKEFLERCAADTWCSSRLGNNPIKTLESLYDDLDRGHCSETGLTRKSLKNTLAELLESQNSRVLIPALIYRLRRCSKDDITSIVYTPPSSVEAPGLYDPLSSRMLEISIKASELWLVPTPSVSTLESWFNASLMGLGPGIYSDLYGYCILSGVKDSSPTCNHIRDAFGVSDTAEVFTYPKDQYYNSTADLSSSTVSLLFLNGLLDPQTPDKYARMQFNNMKVNGDRKKLILFKDSAHITILNTPTTLESSSSCAMSVIVSYIQNDGDVTKIDDSCIAALLPLSFEVDANISISYFGTADAYDGKFEAPSSRRSSIPLRYFVLTILLFSTLIIFLCLLLFYCVGKQRKISKSAPSYRDDSYFRQDSDIQSKSSPTTFTI